MKTRHRPASLLLRLLVLLFALQLSVSLPAQAQGGDNDQPPSTESPPPGSGDVDGAWLEVEKAAIYEPAAARPEIQAATGPPQLNAAYGGSFDEQGNWVDHPTVATWPQNGLAGADLQPYYQEKSKQLDPTRVTFRSGVARRLEAGFTAAIGPQTGVTTAQSTAKRYYLVQFRYPFPIQARQRLEAVGVTFYDNVGPTAMYAHIPPSAQPVLETLVRQGLVRHVGEIPAEAKLDPTLSGSSIAEAGATVDVVVLTFDTPTSAQLQELENLMIIEQRNDEGVHILEGKAAPAAIPALLRLNYVRWVEALTDNQIFNLEGGMGVGGDIVRGSGGAYDGTGVNVMVVDTGIARNGSTYHPDLLAGRIEDQYDYQNSDSNASDDHSHGSHVAGTIGGRYNSGDANSRREAQGMAPNAGFYIYKLADANGSGFLSSWFQSALQRGASGGRVSHISNNSWGGGNNIYNANSEIADRAARGEYNNRPINMVIAAGNHNALISAPGTAKNAITVGLVKDGNYGNYTFNYTACSDKIWPPAERFCFSNFGPVDSDGDGYSRLKPDVMAPGAYIYSATPWYLSNYGYYGYKSGTSMATPHVSGAIAQILDAYSVTAPWLWDWPESVKALLLATTMDVGGNSGQYGRGLINPYHAIYNQSGISSVSFWNSTISSGQTKDFSLSVPAGYREVRVVLTWTDPAGSTEVAHDLDILDVLDGGGASRGFSTSFDDTVEYVRIPGGYTAGNWTIRVKAYSTSSIQRLGLAVHAISADDNLSLTASTEYIPATSSYVQPGNTFYINDYLSNSGFAAGGGYARLFTPLGFTVLGATLYTADGYSYRYSASYIHNEGDSYWRLAVGEVVQGYTRRIRWELQPNPTLANGVYTFFNTPFWRKSGALRSGVTRTNTVNVGRPPLSPANVQASDGLYTGRVQVTWSASSGANGYSLYRATSSNGLKTSLGSTSATTFDDTSATPGVTYYYFVQAYNSYDTSDYSPYDTGYASSLADLWLTKVAEPTTAMPGQAVTYRLSFGNEGTLTANGVVIADDIPDEIIVQNVSSSLTVNQSNNGNSYEWQISTLSPNQNGLITISGIVDPGLSGDAIILNTASISGADDSDPNNNDAEAGLTVIVPLLAFSSDSYSIDEANGAAIIAVTLDPAPEATVAVQYVASDDSAEAGSDYTAANGTLTFPKASTGQTFAIPITNDGVYEGDESLKLSLSNPSGASLSSPDDAATLTITDNDPQPIVQFSATSSNGDEEVSPVNLAVTLSGPADEEVAVDYAVSGTASSGGEDYTLANGVVTIAAGETGAGISFSVNDDPVDEPNETVIVSLSNPALAALGAKTGHTYTIIDNDGATVKVSLAGGSVEVTEGGVADAYEVVLLTQPLAPVTVRLDSNHQLHVSPTELLFTAADWDRPQEVTVSAADDKLYEMAHSGAISHTASSADGNYDGLDIVDVLVNINDNDPQPALSVADLTVDEDTGTAQFSVTLSGQSSLPISVDYVISAGSARPGDDYSAANGTLNWAAAATGPQTVPVIIVDDGEVEAAETVNLTLSSPTVATIADGEAVLTIADNDATGSPDTFIYLPLVLK